MNRNTNINDHTLSDARLKELFKKELPQAPRNPWFVRKVINRLPEKETPTGSRIESMSYLIAVIALIAAWCKFAIGVSAAGVFTGGDLIRLLLTGAVSTIIALSYLAPRVRRWLSEA